MNPSTRGDKGFRGLGSLSMGRNVAHPFGMAEIVLASRSHGWITGSRWCSRSAHFAGLDGSRNHRDSHPGWRSKCVSLPSSALTLAQLQRWANGAAKSPVERIRRQQMRQLVSGGVSPAATITAVCGSIPCYDAGRSFLPSKARLAGPSSPLGTCHKCPHLAHWRKSAWAEQRTWSSATTSRPAHCGHCVRA